MTGKTFYYKEGATHPEFVTTLADGENPVPLSGTAIIVMKPDYGEPIEKVAEILDQEEEENLGKIKVPRITKTDTDENLLPMNYRLEYHVTFADGKTGKYPLGEGAYDDPPVDKLVIQRALVRTALDGLYVYIAYADDDNGTGFTRTFDESKDYIAILSSETLIPTPQADDFAGLWINFKDPSTPTGGLQWASNEW